MPERLLNLAALIVVIVSSTCVVNLYANRDAGALIAVKQQAIIDQYHDQNMTYRDVVRELVATCKSDKHTIENLQEEVMRKSSEIARLEKLCKAKGVDTTNPFGVFNVN